MGGTPIDEATGNEGIQYQDCFLPGFDLFLFLKPLFENCFWIVIRRSWSARDVLPSRGGHCLHPKLPPCE